MIKGVAGQHCRSGAALLCALMLLAGCSGVEEKRQAYRQSESIAPLKIPAPLNAPDSSNAFMLPELQSRPAPDAPPFNTRPPAATNLPIDTKTESQE